LIHFYKRINMKFINDISVNVSTKADS